MTNNPLDNLSSFYKSLDAIPTPNLQVPRPTPMGFWRWAAAPFAASLFAYIFMSICASAPAGARPHLPVELTIDRYALKELKTKTAVRSFKPLHAANPARGMQI